MIHSAVLPVMVMTMKVVTKVMMSIGIIMAFNSSILSMIPTAAGINMTGIRSRSRFPVTSTSEREITFVHKPPRRMNSPYTPAGTGSGHSKKEAEQAAAQAAIRALAH